MPSLITTPAVSRPVPASHALSDGSPPSAESSLSAASLSLLRSISPTDADLAGVEHLERSQAHEKLLGRCGNERELALVIDQRCATAGDDKARAEASEPITGSSAAA